MLTALQAFILGLVEGLTEYLPVSSTGHLILAGQLLGIDQRLVDDYDVVIQFGAILAVLGLYRGRVAEMTLGLFGRSRRGLDLLVRLVVAFLPAAVVGLLFEKKIKAALFSSKPVAAALIVGGLAMIVLDLVLRRRAERHGRDMDHLTIPGALAIGLLQCLAMWPGTSRSLVTILGGLAVGLSPVAAAEFSFLLALPTLGGATALEIVKHHDKLLAAGVPALVIGIVVAAVSAAFAVKAFVAWLVRHGFIPFGVYRILVGAAVLLWLTF